MDAFLRDTIDSVAALPAPVWIVLGLVVLVAVATKLNARRKPRELPGSIARQRAEAELELTLAQTGYYRERAESLRRLRERNHFGTAIESAFRDEEPQEA